MLRALFLLFALIVSRAAASSLELINEDIGKYILQHSRQAVLRDPNLCDRGFVMGTYACPHMVGRGMHEFLNAIIGAYIANRTLVWQFCPRKPCASNDEESCSKYLQRASWIASIDELENAWRSNNCSRAFDRNNQLMDASRRHWSHKKLACCGVDDLEAAIITFGTFLDRRDMYYLSLNTSRLRSEGEDVAYGLMLRASFTFTQGVTDRNSALLRDTGGAVYYGLQIRHSNNDDTGEAAGGEIECLKSVMAMYSLNRSCVLLLASDREQSIARTQQQARSLGCSVVVSNHSIANKAYGEHGPFWGDIAMLDIDLLSRSDFFIGSSYKHFGTLLSSYSMLIAGLVATNSRRSRVAGGVERIRWLPTCGEAVAGQYIHVNATPAHRDEIANVRCSYGLMLPEQCPSYSNHTSSKPVV